MIIQTFHYTDVVIGSDAWTNSLLHWKHIWYTDKNSKLGTTSVLSTPSQYQSTHGMHRLDYTLW